MVRRYDKGARSERELLGILDSNSYSVMRSAGSGVNSLSPDLIAYKDRKGIAFECKAWDGTSVSIPVEKLELLKRWESNTGMDTFIAWRVNGKGWFFIKLDEMSMAEKNYTVTRKRAFEIGRRLEHILEK